MMMQEKENNDTKQTLAQEKLSHYYENIRSNVFSLLGEPSFLTTYKQIIYSSNEQTSNWFYSTPSFVRILCKPITM
jgi:hypothetical protein